MTDEEKRSEESEAVSESGDTAETQGSADSAADDSAADASSGAESSSESKSSSEDSGSHDADAASRAAETEEAAADTEPAQQVAAVAAAHGGHGHGGHGHDEHAHDDHLGHTAPMSLLIGVLIALSLLTILTVAVTAVDLGGQGNFIVAMVIATVKAVLVMGYFMHMFWDSRFNVLAFTSSFLFVLLFLGMTLLDRAEYRHSVDKFENDKKALSR